MDKNPKRQSEKNDVQSGKRSGLEDNPDQQPKHNGKREKERGGQAQRNLGLFGRSRPEWAKAWVGRFNKKKSPRGQTKKSNGPQAGLKCVRSTGDGPEKGGKKNGGNAAADQKKVISRRSSGKREYVTTGKELKEITKLLNARWGS